MVGAKSEITLETLVDGEQGKLIRMKLPDYSSPDWQMLGPVDEQNPIGFYNITDSLKNIAKSYKVAHMQIQPPHTTMRIILNEAEEGYLKDRARNLQEQFPADRAYDHNENHFPEYCKNGHAHLMADTLPLIQGLLVSDGSLDLGNYLSAFAMDLYPLEEGKVRYVDVMIIGVLKK